MLYRRSPSRRHQGHHAPHHRRQRPKGCLQLVWSARQARTNQSKDDGTIEITRLTSRVFADDVRARCLRTRLCRFLRSIFIAEFASDVGSVSPNFSSAIKQRASWDCLSEAPKTSNIGSNSTNAHAFSNAMLRISVSAESKKFPPEPRGIAVLEEVMKGSRASVTRAVGSPFCGIGERLKLQSSRDITS
jgi:hypothetical protein